MSLRSFTAIFLRRRHAVLPTVWGWIALLLGIALIVLTLGRFANRWLSVNDPAKGPDGQGAHTLVVEGWLDPFELDRAAEVFRQRRYDRLLTTGGPTYGWEESTFGNYADRAADYLRRHGVPAAKVISLPAPASAQDRTFLSAVMVREWALRERIALVAIDVFSGGAHARRSRMLYRMAFGPAVEIGIMSGALGSFDEDRWWTSSSGVKTLTGEIVSIGYTVCCFWPPEPGSFEERWAIPKSAAPVRVPDAPVAHSAEGSPTKP